MGTSNLFHRAGQIASLIFLTWLCVQVTGRTAPRPRFEVADLGSLPGGSGVFPLALNNHGHVVGWAFASNGLSRPFVFRDGRMTELPVGDVGYQAPYFINDASQIVVQGIATNSSYRAYFLTAEGIIDLHAQTGVSIQAVGLNNAGVIAGMSPGAAITWSNGVVRYLDPTYGSGARDINNRGEVVGVFHLETPPGPNFFTTLMHNGAVSVLGAGFIGEALNDHGHVVGVSYFGGRHAVLYRDGEVINLGALRGDTFSSAWKINNAGQIIGDSEDEDDHVRAFFYSDGKMYSLNELIPPNSGWRLFYASDLNDRGQIIGAGTHDGIASGEYRGFLLTPTKKLR